MKYYPNFNHVLEWGKFKGLGYGNIKPSLAKKNKQEMNGWYYS